MTIRPSIRLSSLPQRLPLDARLAIARDAGFEGIEAAVDDVPIAALKVAADAHGLAVHSLYCWDNYTKPLSSPEPAVRDAGVASILATLEAAHQVGAETMLLVAGTVDRGATYGEVYARSQDVIRRAILPEAERLGLILAIENVWTGFLLSPYDCARYIDDLGSPAARLCLDVGNIVFGHPEGWIDIAGHCIVSLHLKDLIHWRGLRRYRTVRVGEGEIDWPRVRAALARAEFSGWGVMAEAELALPFPWPQAFAFGRRWAPALEAAVSRRVVSDAMRRFRRYVVPG